MPLGYAALTPVRDEAASLVRLRASLEAQTVRPAIWHIVDTGSCDGSAELAEFFARNQGWIRVMHVPGSPARQRGAPVVLALEAGFRELEQYGVDIVVKVDADVTMTPAYFALLLEAFEADPRLGMASGRRLEPTTRGWKERRSTFGSVEAQCRAYRWSCLEAALPFERSIGWDGIDEVKAALAGWRTAVLEDLSFRHHRPIGARERSQLEAWRQAGHGAWYMGYRPSYLLLRAAYHSLRDPAAVGLAYGFLASSVRRAPRCDDARVRSSLRRKQALRSLPARVREVTGMARPVSRRHHVQLLLVADPGGHLCELVGLREVWSRFSRAWVTVAGADTRIIPAGERVFCVRGPTRRSFMNLLRNTVLAFVLVRRLRPAVVLSTGAGLAVPFAWVGRILGARVVYVECSGRVGLSLGGRLVAPVASRFYAQWPEVAAAVSRARFAGTIFLSTR